MRAAIRRRDRASLGLARSDGAAGEVLRRCLPIRAMLHPVACALQSAINTSPTKLLRTIAFATGRRRTDEPYGDILMVESLALAGSRTPYVACGSMGALCGAHGGCSSSAVLISTTSTTYASVRTRLR